MVKLHGYFLLLLAALHLRKPRVGDPNPRHLLPETASAMAGPPKPPPKKAPPKRAKSRAITFPRGAVEMISTPVAIECSIDGPMQLRSIPTLTGEPFKETVFAADLSKANLWSGLPWANGILRLEKNPAHFPLKAVGARGQTGLYADVANTPHIVGAFEQMALAASNAPWRLEKAELPPWAADDPIEIARRDKHHEYAERMWWEWTRSDAGKRTLWTLIQTIFRTAPKYGFYLGELIADEVTLTLENDETSPRVYWIPRIPEWRAPFSRAEWIIQDGDYVGVIIDNSSSTDSDGTPGEHLTVISMQALLHVMARDENDNPEGTSHCKPLINTVESYRKKQDIELLSISADGTGTRTIESSESRPLSPKEIVDAGEYLSNYEARDLPWYIPPAGASLKIVSANPNVQDIGGSIVRDERAMGFALINSADLVAKNTHGSFGALTEANAKDAEPNTEMALSYFARPFSAQIIGRFTQWSFPEDHAENKIYASRITATVERTDVGASIGHMAVAVKDGLLANPDTRMPTAALLELDIEPLPVLEAVEVEEEIDLLPPPVIQPSRADLMTVAEAAAMTRQSTTTIRKLVKAGELVRAGSNKGRSLFRVEDLEQLLVDEPDPEALAEEVEDIEE